MNEQITLDIFRKGSRPLSVVETSLKVWNYDKHLFLGEKSLTEIIITYSHNLLFFILFDFQKSMIKNINFVVSPWTFNRWFQLTVKSIHMIKIEISRINFIKNFLLLDKVVFRIYYINCPWLGQKFNKRRTIWLKLYVKVTIKYSEMC